MNELPPLRDIETLDAISWWPLAVGWWFIAILLVLLSLAGLGWFYRYKKRMTAWQHHALKHLSDIEANVDEQDSQLVLIELSQTIRRIALAKFPRSACAGKIGSDWLSWLTENDPNGFNWNHYSEFLITMPYQPQSNVLTSTDIKQLIQAIKGWVH